MQSVYICSPYAAKDPETLERNISYAKQLTKYAAIKHYTPVTPHLYLPLCLDDNNPEQRTIGLEASIHLLSMCDIVFLATDFGISKGMEKEYDVARELGKKIIYLNRTNNQFCKEIFDKYYQVEKLTMCDEYDYMLDFTKEIAYFDENPELDKLKILWTAYCLHRHLTVDVNDYDPLLKRIYDTIITTHPDAKDLTTYSMFKTFMSDMLY